MGIIVFGRPAGYGCRHLVRGVGIDEYQLQLNAAADRIATAASDVAIRGHGAARFVFATGNGRSIELSTTDNGVWVEYWNDDDGQPDHACLFHTFVAATADAINWLGRTSILDKTLSCMKCGFELTLRQGLDNASRSWPDNNWISVLCSNCGTTTHLRLQSRSLSVGILDGFPAPNFVAERTLATDTMSFAVEPSGITVYYQSLFWFVPAERS